MKDLDLIIAHNPMVKKFKIKSSWPSILINNYYVWL